MRSPHRRRYVALAVLFAGILIVAGCGGDGGGEEVSAVEELLLQPAAAQGPDPFTPSTVTRASWADPPVRPSSPDAQGVKSTVRAPRALPGSTPGLYGGTPSASCEVARQVRLLTEDQATARAFAEGAGVTQAAVPDFLRGLTPVVLRPDIRVTNHGYRDGSAAAFQSVLQAGTAVMVDNRGVPRVRCADGSPLRPPIAAAGSVRYRGKQWQGYLPERIVVINRASEVITSLVIVDLSAHTWTERQIGTTGQEDKPPQVLPQYGPEADITDPEAVKPPRPALPDVPTGVGSASPGDSSRSRSTPDRGPAATDQPQDAPFVPDDGPLPPDAQGEPELSGGDFAPSGDDLLTGPDDDPGAVPGDELFPPVPDGRQSGDELVGHDSFVG